jgi:hypothetical protein
MEGKKLGDDRPSEIDRMHQASGSVMDTRPLVAFLYQLLRDHLVAGTVERLADGATATGLPIRYTNGWLARHCQDLADRLTAPPLDLEQLDPVHWVISREVNRGAFRTVCGLTHLDQESQRDIKLLLSFPMSASRDLDAWKAEPRERVTCAGCRLHGELGDTDRAIETERGTHLGGVGRNTLCGVPIKLHGMKLRVVAWGDRPSCQDCIRALETQEDARDAD